MNFPTRTVGSFPDGSYGKESTCNGGDMDSIPGSRRPSGEGNGTPLQYSCLENPTDRGAWGLQSLGCKEWDTTEWLSTQARGKLCNFSDLTWNSFQR